MKKKVFDLPTFVKWSLKNGYTKEDIIHYIANWAYDCHGLTKEEMNEKGYTNNDNWCIEIDVPRYKVGDYVQSTLLTLQIRKVLDKGYKVNIVDEYGEFEEYGKLIWFDKELEDWTPKEKHKFSIGDVVKYNDTNLIYDDKYYIIKSYNACGFSGKGYGLKNSGQYLPFDDEHLWEKVECVPTDVAKKLFGE